MMITVRSKRAPSNDVRDFLTQVLQIVLGGRTDAVLVLHQALEEAGRSSLPEEPAQIVDFVRGYLLERVAALTGPRVAMAMLDEIGKRAEERSAPMTHHSQGFQPSSRRRLVAVPRPRMMLIDSDSSARGVLAGLLLRGGVDLDLHESMENVAIDSCAVVIAAVRTRKDLSDLTRMMSGRRTRFVVIAHESVSSIDATIRAATAEVVPGGMPAAGVAAISFAQLDAAFD